MTKDKEKKIKVTISENERGILIEYKHGYTAVDKNISIGMVFNQVFKNYKYQNNL